MEVFTLAATAFEACIRLKATLRQMQYIFALKRNKENTTCRELKFFCASDLTVGGHACAECWF